MALLSARGAENFARQRDRGLRQWSTSVFEDDAREFLGRVGFACLEPVNGDAELGCELAQCPDARLAGIRFEAADVCVGDAFACEFALTEPEFNPSLTDPFSDGAQVRLDRNRVLRWPGSKPAAVLRLCRAGASSMTGAALAAEGRARLVSVRCVSASRKSGSGRSSVSRWT